MFQKLRTIIYHTEDLAAAKAWYIKATGKEPYFDQPFYIGFDINGFELGLDPDMTHAAAGNHSVAYWKVEAIDEAVAHLLNIEARLVQEKTEVGHEMYVAIVADPFGNHIGLIQHG